MLKRDLIMVQIEELGKMITQIALNRNSNDGAHKNLELIQAAYTALRLNFWTVRIRVACIAWI